MTIVEFLLQRIAEDEAVARAASPGVWVEGVKRAGRPGHWQGIEAYSVIVNRGGGGVDIDDIDDVADSKARTDVIHIARHDPARVLAEVEAKRRIVEGLDKSPCVPCALGDECFHHNARASGIARQRFLDPVTEQVLSSLASIYSDSPEYREEWRAS